nr:Uncharacterised protein [Streptococcus thermophilus]
MPHHDFYSSLGLDRDRDAATLAATIDWRLADSDVSPAKRDELQVARKILGDERRRALYDARLNDADAPAMDVAALRELAQKARPDAKPKPKQYFPDTDPNAEAVSPAQQYPSQPPAYYQPPMHAPDERRRGRAVPVIFGVVVVIGALGAGGWWLLNNFSEPWEPEDQFIADAFPRIVSEENGQRGWLGMRCMSKEPEQGQDARIRCADKQLGVSVMDYGTVEARDAMLPDGDSVVLSQDECEAHSYERAGQDPPAYVIAPQGQDGQFLLVVNGDEAENKRLHLNMCDKTRE